MTRTLPAPLTVLACWTVLACDEAPPPAERAPACDPAPGRICPWAGAGTEGFDGDGNHRLDSWLSFPTDTTFSPHGDPVVADWNNHRVRQVAADGTLHTIIGTDIAGDGDPGRFDSSALGAEGTTVRLNLPTQQRYLPDGTLLCASWNNHKLRTWDPATHLVHVLAGSDPGFRFAGGDPDARSAQFDRPVAVEIDGAGDVYVVDSGNQRVRHLRMADFTITTVLGGDVAGYCGDDGPATSACVSFPDGVMPEPGGAVALSPDQSLLYVADTGNHVLRVVDLATGTVRLYAGSPELPGDVDGPLLQARFRGPRDLAMSPDGVLYVADTDNHKVRAVDTATGQVSTFAGTGEPSCGGDGPLAVPRTCDDQLAGGAGDGGDRLAATLYRPFGVEIDLAGDVVIADTFSHRIRVASP